MLNTCYCSSLPSLPPHLARFQKCDPTGFEVINNCGTLRSRFECASCSMSEGADLPALASDSVHPSQCLFNSNAGDSKCSGKHVKTRRVCMCMP